MRKSFTIAALVALSTTTSVRAQSTINGCMGMPQDELETHVYFANGILTESGSADDTVAYLRGLYKVSLENTFEDQTYSFYSAYNPTVGPLTDVTEVLQQKMMEEGIANEGLSAAQLLSLLRAGLANDAIRRTVALTVGASTRLPPLLTDAFLEETAIALGEAQANAIAAIPNVQSLHSNFYTSDLVAGKRVFVIAHSQGNLFTNASLQSAAASLPNSADSLAMIGVATPAAQQFRSSFYRTADDDRVIQALDLIENVAPANIDNDPGVFNDFRSLTNHYFEQDYMDERLRSRSAIDQELLRLANTVPFPTVTAGEGAIRATLTWDAQPDVDLHAFEPDGTQVFYLNRSGPSGFLDVDDVNGFGPENYFVACNTVRPGVYRIGVNYFSGSAPTTATVSLFLGDGRTPAPRTVVLQTPRGSSGNSSPQIVFTIGVAVQDGQVRYTVE